jgi:DNA-directed RNA polymerase subunit RPC12/RpoP
MAKYKCSVCGYIYDEEKEGQPLLDSKCPVCGMMMVLMEENDSEAAASTALEADAAPEELAYDPAYARCDASCRHMDDIHEMAVTGKSIIGAMGTPMPMPGWDDILLLGNQLIHGSLKGIHILLRAGITAIKPLYITELQIIPFLKNRTNILLPLKIIGQEYTHKTFHIQQA